MVAPDKAILVIAAYNEEKNIGYILSQAAMLKSCGMISEFVVVDDGSQDSTSRVASEGGAAVIRIAENKGKGNAVLQGLLYCKNEGAQIAILADADTLSGVTQKQVAYLLDELKEHPSMPKTMMAVYPQSWIERDIGGKLQTTQEFSGFRALRVEGLNFLFASDGNWWKFAETPAAKWFIANAQEYRLETELNRWFRKRTSLLSAVDASIETLPFGRGNDDLKRKIRSHIRDCTEKNDMWGYNLLVVNTQRKGLLAGQKIAAVF